jgi:trehalose 6-phosphate synthase/phosphatase
MTTQLTPAGATATAAAASATAAASPGRDGAGRRFIAAERLPVSLSPAERQSCEDGFVQRALWPLLHDLAPLASFELGDWQAFRAVNRKFARAAAQVVTGAGVHRGAGGPAGRLRPLLGQAPPTGRPGDLVFAQDPRLMGLAAELRRLRAPVEAVYFMRPPFPAPDLLLRLPWRDRLLAGLLAFDRLGFQTRRDLGNFLDSVQLVFGEVAARRGAGGVWSLSGRAGERTCAVAAGVYPEGVDAAGIARAAASPEVERRLGALRAAAGPAGSAGAGRGRRRQWVLAVDTLSPEEGTPEKLRAFAAALELRPALRDTVSLQLVVEPGPAAGTAAAAARRREIERLVGEINGRLGRAGCVPVRYRFQELEAAERLALYRAADVALVTPLRAGMGLAAKEYCAADLEEQGALVLSEFAGAAVQLGGGALLVNPHDVGAAARTLTAALRSGGDERRRRMRLLRDEVRAHDVSWWMRELLPETHLA